MKMPSMLEALRIELQDTDNNNPLWLDSELERAVYKSVSLMSRLIPKRAIVETKVTLTVTGESLVITSSTGTLAYKPAKVDTVIITGKTLDTDYTINYLTGVVTEIGSNLPDTTYTVSYTIDPHILNIASILSDYIKLDRIEYPAGDTPSTFITPLQEVYATYLVFKEDLTENKHLRINYTTYWTPPTATADGDFPRSLDNAIIVGSSGQALIYKAEKYTQSAVNALSTLTPPTDYSFSKPSMGSSPSAPVAPTAPTLSWTTLSAALTAIGTEITAAKAHITSGVAVVNLPNPGQNVAENYGKYADSVFGAANTRVQEALANIKQQEDIIALYASQVTAYGSAVNAYANEISEVNGEYREDVNAESAGIANYKAQIDKYVAEVNDQQMKATNYLNIAGRYLASGQAKINEMLVMLGLKPEYNMYQASSEQFS
jgi:hypothetical protein